MFSTKAAELAKTSHAGQKYDNEDYFEAHLEIVASEVVTFLDMAGLDVWSFKDELCEDLLSAG